jgi:putative chitinase
VNVDTLLATMPGLSRGDADRYLPLMEAAMREYGATSEMRARMWLAQVGHESGSLRYFEEIADGSAYEGRKDLGNTQPGDGKKYKGRGPIQVTGRYNYTEAAGALGLPLVDRPEMAADPPHAFRISAWWWKAHGLNEISDTGDVVAATKRINGGTNGLSDRQSRYELARRQGAKVAVSGGPSAPKPPSGSVPPWPGRVLRQPPTMQGEDVRTWQQQMRARGWQLDADGYYGPGSERVCRQFQAEKALDADGQVGPATWAAAWTAPTT